MSDRDVAKFFSQKRAIRKEGIFILDGSILSLPDNINYENAQYIPLDSDKNYIDTDKIPLYGAKPTLCYKTLNLLHISKDKDYFVFCANRIVGSKSHGKPVGDDFYPAFSLVFKLTYRFITKPENSIYIYKFLDTTIECYNI